MKCVVDYDKCAGLAMCESLAPEFFEVNDDGDLIVLRADIPEDELEIVKQAVAACPTEALTIAR